MKKLLCRYIGDPAKDPAKETVKPVHFRGPVTHVFYGILAIGQQVFLHRSDVTDHFEILWDPNEAVQSAAEMVEKIRGNSNVLREQERGGQSEPGLPHGASEGEVRGTVDPDAVH